MATVQSLITGRLQVTVGINVTVRESRFEKTVKNSYQFVVLFRWTRLGYLTSSTGLTAIT